MDVKHPEIHVRLVGEDGNAFAILGRVRRAMVRAGMGDEVDAFHEEATAGNYEHLLGTVLRWFTVDADIEDGPDDEWGDE